MITNDLQSVASKIQKVAQLAFDPAVTPGEMQTAITKMVELAQKYGINYYDFKLLLDLIVPAAQSSPKPEKKKTAVSKSPPRANEDVLRALKSYMRRYQRDWDV